MLTLLRAVLGDGAGWCSAVKVSHGVGLYASLYHDERSNELNVYHNGFFMEGDNYQAQFSHLPKRSEMS
jgi:hypothetical protein